MLPHELVLKHYKLPFALRRFQEEVIEELADLPRTGLFMDVGTGKTAVSTVIALYKKLIGEIEQTLVLMPPILLPQWYMWLQEIGASAAMYRGFPAVRQKMKLGADFILMSQQIFKRDYARLWNEFRPRNFFTIIDEASSVRNPATQNYKRVRDFTLGQQFTLLTGTAINNPLHAYGYIKLKTPSIYRSFDHFKQLHVTNTDFFGQPTAYANLDLLAESLLVNSVRVKADDVLDLPEIQYIPVHYELVPAHMKLYRKLMDEQLLQLEDGSVIDATTAQRLYHISQQIILSPAKYGAAVEPSGFRVLDETLDDLEGSKLVIFNNYQATNEAVFDYLVAKGLNPVLCYGGSRSRAGLTERNLQKFLLDPMCRICVASPKSIGVGLNLQSACRYILFLELPLTSNDFAQAVGRVHRQGQDKSVFIKIAIAIGTIQEYLRKQVAEKDDLVQQIMPSKQNLRAALYGENVKEMRKVS